MHASPLSTLILCCLAALAPVITSAVEPIAPGDRNFFETKIRPVLVEHCYACHSAESKELGGKLRLDTRAGLLAGGESGPALNQSRPMASLLLQAIRYDGFEMPPKAPLPPNVVRDFEQWVRRGAPDPRLPIEGVADGANNSNKADGDPAKDLWSLKSLSSPPIPSVKDADWPRNSIDSFVLAAIEERGLGVVNDATPRALVQRLFVDLLGLAPTLDEIEQFQTDVSEHGLERATTALVDELLSRPQFGERWGRHWLDVARYAESNGNDGLGRNPTFPHAWRYRDYVIDSWNVDRPYDEFLAEQIAGDLLRSDTDAVRDRRLIATGFLAMAAKPAKAMNNNFAMDVVADQLDVIGRGILGLSIGCARCHDHKFDPIPTRDYYALAGIFTSTETMWGVAGHEGLTAPPTDLHVLKSVDPVAPPKGFVETVIVLESATGKPKKIPKSKWAAGTPLAMGVRDKQNKKQIADCKLNIKGDAKKLGAAVPRGFLSALPSDAASQQGFDGESGRRQLAEWLQANPLAARVIVNRIWMQLFGEGIVSTVNDFGVYGQRPTHPELLEHLAYDLRANDWSLKRLIRKIVLSRTYRLSCDDSIHDERRSDRSEKWLTHHRRRRLDAESLRDKMLQASGQLDLQPAEGSVVRHRDILVNLAGNSLHQPSRHRSVYLCYLRSSPPPELSAFDLPDFSSVVGKRNVSTVPSQSLHLFNSPFVQGQAAKLAERMGSHVDTLISNPQDPVERRAAMIRLGYRFALQRDPTAEEFDLALKMVESSQADEPSPQAWIQLAHALLITNEFRFVD